MKLLRFGERGAERPAVRLAEGRVVDVSPLTPDFTPSFFAEGGLERLRRRLPEIAGDLAVVDLERTRIGACVPRPSQVLAIGLNYADHAAEAGMVVPAEPVLFNKAPNAVVGPNDDLLIPRKGEKTDWEIELALILGARARYLPDEPAGRAAVAGYCIANDVSERSFQLEREGQWVKGKSCETFCPLGPWLVTADEVPDPQDLAMRLTVNGETMQKGSTRTMVFGVGYLVWYLSQFMVLEPGDVVLTGTPPGVGMGRRPPRYLCEGDVVELSIEGLGRQRMTCRRA